jgi:thioredoxin-related protein
MKTLFGGLCIVSFFISSVACLSCQRSKLEAKDSKSSPVHSKVVEHDQALKGQRGYEEKAYRLVAVTSKTCDPCRRLKEETLPVLQKEGYRVSHVNFRIWNGPEVSMVPTLFYFDADNKLITEMTEIGFRTPGQIKKKLAKP